MNKKIGLIQFYSKTGFLGMFIVPFLAVLSGSLYVSSFLTVIACILKIVINVFNIEVPFSILNFGFGEFPIYFEIPIALLFAVLFFFGGKKLWIILKKYIENVRAEYREIKK